MDAMTFIMWCLFAVAIVGVIWLVFSVPMIWGGDGDSVGLVMSGTVAGVINGSLAILDRNLSQWGQGVVLIGSMFAGAVLVWAVLEMIERIRRRWYPTHSSVLP